MSMTTYDLTVDIFRLLNDRGIELSDASRRYMYQKRRSDLFAMRRAILDANNGAILNTFKELNARRDKPRRTT